MRSSTSLFLAAMTMALHSPIGAQAAAPAPAFSPAAGAFDQAVAGKVLAALATALEDNFVLPSVGKKYAEAIRAKAAAGGYAQHSSPEALAEAVTADLQAIHKDGHLRLFAPAVQGKKPKYRTEPDIDGAIGRSGWLSDGVAYIELTVFPGDPATLAKLRHFLESHRTAASLIIDIRGHHGGEIAEIDLLSSYLYGAPAVLAQMDTRVAAEEAGLGAFGDGPTLRRVAGPAGVVRREHFVTPRANAGPLTRAKVFLLTSKRSISAAEHLAMSFKKTGRATLVGETTAGAGHYGDPYPLPGGFKVFIPSGRSFDPTTGEGWEGEGIAPDVAVPADQALDEALRLAGVGKPGAAALAELR